MLLLSRCHASHRVGALKLRPHVTRHAPVGRRNFIGNSIQTLSEGFLDLAIALPLPPSLPPYSTTIILVTVATRLFFTVPFSVWAKKRQWDAEDVVLPALREARPQVIEAVRSEMAKNRVTGTKEQLQMAFSKRVEGVMKTRRNQLFAEQGWSQKATIAIPIVTQLPLFIGSSVVFARACAVPTPLDSEAFLTLTSLAHVDPTATLPIVLGVITYANVESSRWFLTAEQRERERKVEEYAAAKRAKGELVIKPRNILQSALRLFSMARIIIAAMVPGGVVVYWVTSATFGLLQTWAFDWWERRRELRKASVPLPQAIVAAAPGPLYPPASTLAPQHRPSKGKKTRG